MPRIPRPRQPVLPNAWATLHRCLRRNWRRLTWGAPAAAERVLPLLVCFAGGVVIGLTAADQRADDELYAAEARAVLAKRRQIAAENLAGQYAAACGQRLSWPVESTPEIIPTAAGGRP